MSTRTCIQQWSYQPRIIHLAGPNKPWKYAGAPWASVSLSTYTQLLNAHPFLTPFLKTMDIPSTSQQTVLYIKDVAHVLRHPRGLVRSVRGFLTT